MQNKPVTIELSQGNYDIKATQTEENLHSVKTGPKYNITELKYILIGILIIIVIFTFIFILAFVILKKKDKNDKIPVIFDVDEGGDDMIACIVANNSKKYDILGVTTVSSYYYVEDVGKIWLRFFEYMNFNNKIYLGENHPLIRPTNKYPFSNYYGIEFPNITKKYETKSGIDFMYETIKNHKKKVTLFLLGPLTNFAKVYQRDKSIINNIENIIIMGGAKEEGNVDINPKADYNIYNDAEAANILFNCGKKITVIGSEVKMDFSDEIYKKLIDMDTRSSLFTYYAGKGVFETWGNNWVYDPITVLYHINHDIIELKDYYIQVNTSNPDKNWTEYGSMYFYEPNNKINPNVEYSEKIDYEKCYETLFIYLNKY